MTLSQDKFSPDNFIEQTQAILEVGKELQEQELLLKLKLELVQTKQQLIQEQQLNSELKSKLVEFESQLTGFEPHNQPFTLKQVPSWAEITQNHYPSFADDLVDAPCPQQKLKICIVTQDIFGPIRNGGIGTAFYYAANFLRDCGHDVTILYSLGNYCETGTIEEWIDYYAQRNIKFVPAPEPQIPSAPGSVARSMLVARRVYEYLKTQTFDLVHVSEWRGNGFYALLAKKLGIAFANTTFCIKTSSPSLWGKMGNNALIDNPQDLLRSYIERKSVEWGDIIIAPSRHMLGWMERHGYELPKEKCYVQPNIMLVSDSIANQDFKQQGYLNQVQELVFFGRLEPRKGIQIFCKALTKLAQEGGINCKVTFLGKFNPQNFDAQAYIQAQAQNWSFPWEMITDYNALQAMEYLKTNNRLAVVPSLLDNSPFTIYECLSERIPFICSDRGGTPELVHPEDHAQVVLPAHPTKLAKRLRTILNQGVIVARPAFDFQDNLHNWAQWHLAIGHNPNLRLEGSGIAQNLLTLPIKKNEKPLVSVCVAHFNRPQELSQAIESLKHQTYENYEVIVVDDGSEKPEAIAYLDSLEADFADRGWRIVRQENLYLGAVRNTSARNARGEYLMFMDDDNCAKPHEIETFVAAANYTNADVLTCFADVFAGTEAPQPDSAKYRLTPTGDCVSYGMLENCYGDSNCLVKRSFFDQIGGFTEDYGVGKDDMEFFSRAVLKGGKLLVIPESLYWYRASQTRLRHLHFDLNAGSWRVFRPYLDNLPWASHDLLRLVMGLFKTYSQTRGKVANLKNLSEQTQQNLQRLSKLIENNSMPHQ